MRTVTSPVITVAHDRSLTDMAGLWEAISTDPLKGYFWSDGSPTTFTEFYNYLVGREPGERLVWGAECDGSLVAYALVKRILWYSAPAVPLYGELEFYIIPAARRYRRAIAQVWLTAMAACKITRLFGFIHPEHRRGLAFAERMGGVRLCLLPDYAIFQGEPCHAWLYTYQVTQNTGGFDAADRPIFCALG